MRNHLALVLLCIAPVMVFAQKNGGFYGKKAFVELSSSSYSPIIYNLITSSQGYKRVKDGSNQLKQFKKWFHTGVRASIGYSFRPKFGISLEGGFDQFPVFNKVLTNFKDQKYPEIDNFSVSKHESINVNALTLLTKFELSTLDGQLPSGIVHQLGFGLIINKVVQDDYIVHAISSSNFTPNGYKAPFLGELTDLTKPYHIIRVMYGFKMRSPISKSMMISYGFSYSLDLGLPIQSGNYYGYPNEIRRYQFRNIIAFDLGITLPF